MKAIKRYMALGALSVVLASSSVSCKKFLDIVPDNVATIEYAFRLRVEAEKYLFTLYNYLPSEGSLWNNPAFLGGDEIWIPYQTSISPLAFEIARGNQQISKPYVNYWYGDQDANRGLYQGIRHCNIFIDNMSNPALVPDITASERARWIAEARFLKAYFHFYLLRMYGPVPIMDDDIDVSEPKEVMDVPRNTVDECVEYIVGLLDQAAADLPPQIVDRQRELGRITIPIAKAVKAQVLLLAASPLFNGNADFSSLKNKDGKALFNPTADTKKWELAATAAREAIEVAEANMHALFTFRQAGNLAISDTTLLELKLRQAVCEKFNEEHIWADPNSRSWTIQQNAMPPLTADENHNYNRKILSPPLKIAKMFYTKNGVPITEDKTLSFTDDTELRTATGQERFYIEPGFTTARLHFDREPRFYSSLAFDGARWFKYDTPGYSDENSKVVRSKRPDYAGSTHAFHFNETGYFIKKLVDWNQVTTTTGVTYKDYPWPKIRLADLYLMYAEALNEAYGPANETAFQYIDQVRARAGLKGVKESWTTYAKNPGKFTTKEGFRDIIHRERLIELAFEGQRFWDLRRWKTAAVQLNEPITGWNMQGETTAAYYVIRTVFNQRFIAPRDYFWPISENTVIQNLNLVQNYGW
ncbi:RagB/SusD family nutrient uptake outer membrane protein [Sphingobacterium thalpophilum]|uniref:RagB/SusD family nutrient uptake outer membrane protein n=1 Tax=Sphingobacterium thalpophilum TaxID=259 RepID=UPI002D78D2B9|nr:RagB/SusD family nutrient uptake outer membrane protein [Sphingobacterium thalpophilum]